MQGRSKLSLQALQWRSEGESSLDGENFVKGKGGHCMDEENPTQVKSTING